MVSMILKVIKSIFIKPFTTDYPKKKAKISVNYRGMIHVDQKNCIACRLCEINCPTNAIIVDKEKKYAVVDRDLCIFCGLCAEVCPVKVIWFSNDHETARADRKEFDKQVPGPNPAKKVKK
jgi:formate hydrogenlyase subunit 6/NADH:ubiquinone oxidoreductase subunit I